MTAIMYWSMVTAFITIVLLKFFYARYITWRKRKKKHADRKWVRLLLKVEKAKDALKFSQYRTEEKLKNFETDRIELTFDHLNYLILENGDAYWEFRGRQFECLRRLLQVKELEFEIRETIPIIGSRNKGVIFGIKSPSD